MAQKAPRRKKVGRSRSAKENRSKPNPRASDASASSGQYAVTTVRLTADQYEWLRRTALERALAEGGKADASAVIRELVEAARKRQR